MAKKTGKSKKGKGAKGEKNRQKEGKKGGKKGGKKAASLAPVLVKAGKGAPLSEVATQFVHMFNAQPGNERAIWDALFHKKFASVEGGMRWEGRKAVEAKSADFYAKNEVHSCACEGPYIGTDAFGVRYTVDMTDRASGQRMQMTELACYTVKNGKVVEEQFLYGMSPSPAAQG